MPSSRKTYPPMNNPLAAGFLFEGGRRGVLLIHGFTGTPAQMRPLGEALHRDGYTVLGVLLPGHGTSIEDMEGRNWCDWLRAARDAFNELARRCDDICVAGLSMGGILSLILASELPVTAAVSIAAPLRLQNGLAYWAFVLKYFVRRRRWPKEPGEGNSYHVGYSETPIRKLPDFIRLARIAENGLANIRCPLLVVQPSLDGTVRADSPDLIRAGAVNAASIEILRLEKSRHVCTVEPEFDALYGAVSKLFGGK